ncbi:MAG: hypothetical protein HN685_02500 [Waddliaceae bacterium]|nr:hypothetical protein [Waddliaceae bacterium]
MKKCRHLFNKKRWLFVFFMLFSALLIYLDPPHEDSSSSTIACDTIGLAIYSMRNDPNVIKREVTTRAIALTVPLFSTADVICNSFMTARAYYRRATSDTAVEKRAEAMSSSYLSKQTLRNIRVTTGGGIAGAISPKFITKHLGCYTDEIFPRTEPYIIGDIYKTLDVIDKIFKKHSITYWATGGTALGAVRHGGVIPWDDDADIAFFEDEEDKIYALKEEFSIRGYEIIPCWHGYKVFPKDGDDINEQFRYPFVDMFPMKLSEGRFIFSLARVRMIWGSQFHFPEEIENIKRYSFGPITIPIPGNQDRYLCEAYGIDWNDHGYLYVNQHDGTLHIPIKYPVRIISRWAPEYIVNKEKKDVIQ